MLKIYKHIKAQAMIKVNVGEDKDGQPLFQNIKFKGGRNLGTDAKTVGGTFHTSNERLQESLESRSDFGRYFFIDHKIETSNKSVSVEEKDFRIFPGVDTINRVKNTLRTEFSSQIKGEDLRDNDAIFKCCKRVGAAFPDFFVHEQGHFADKLDKAAEAKEKAEEVKEPIKPVEKPKAPEQTEPESKPEQEFEEIEVDPEELRLMFRKELNKLASDFGVPSPEKLSNKEAVIQEILKQ